MRATKTVIGFVAATGVSLLAVQTQSRAHPSYLTAFNTKYPAAATTLSARMASVTGSSCNVCHTPGDTAANGSCYKDAVLSQLNSGFTIAQALNNVALLDSDGDGTPNEVEILLARTDLPGQIGYHPGLKGPTGTGPCNSNTTAAVTNQLETPPAGCYANCDNSSNAPVLNALDFGCFLTKYAAADTYANCDNSTNAPILNALDFGCFLTKYAAGCT